MNPAQAPGQQAQPQPQQAQPQGQPGQQARTPMYQPAQIRNLPHLTDDEKRKYEAGLRNLWGRANSTAPNSQEHMQARQKITDFTRMLVSKIHSRRATAQQAQQAGGGQGQPQPQPQPAAQPQTQTPAQQQPTQQPQPQPQQPPQAQAQAQAQAQSQSSQQQQQQQSAAANIVSAQQSQATAPAPPNATAAAAQQQKAKVPDQVMAYVKSMSFRAPLNLKPDEAQKWVSDLEDRYGRALLTMESSKKRLAQMDQTVNDRKQQGNPLREDELRAFQVRKEQQMKLHSEAHKWIEGIRKSQNTLQGNTQGAPNAGTGTGAAATQPAAQPNSAQAAGGNTVQANAPASAPNAVAAVNAATEAVRNQAAAANRASPANGASTPTQPPTRPTPSVNQPATQPPQAPGLVHSHMQGQMPQQPHPPPVNTAIPAAAAMQNQGVGTPTQAGARVQTPQSATAATAGGPGRALSHSAAMSLANQRATNTPGSAPVQGQQASGGTPTPTGGAINPGIMAPSAQHQQGHPHAHPTQSQQTIQSKMPIPKHLPERATSVPQGVTVGGGVNSGRPTMSQGGGTLGGVMNQAAVARIPAYSHEAEGDHVLSKKKLDELVRQVCGGGGEGQEANLLTPEVEENVLNIADSFVDNVLNAACRNAKERGSKVLEIRDMQLVLERTYNIRIPGYSSDELRTVRKVMPSAGWIAKMSAVQAAKVMPGKTD